ncbi:hypothetical protein BUE80_DR005130 [Diplocarpon rosae]|nr:hypothetical protein BUE80_DR005130 [Diplocarpon rosae]
MAFLDLPREIRDEIYDYVLRSPTGLITPTYLPRPNPLKPSRRRKASPQTTRVRLISTPLPPYDPPIRRGMFISLALPCACRQIYYETHGLFWSKNTFHFSGFLDSGHGPGIVRTLKTMGQTASRLIQRITIQMPLRSHQYSGFRKVLHTLSSRARLGHFKRLELVWGEEEFEDLALAWRAIRNVGEMRLFDEMLTDLWVGDEARFERVVRVPARDGGAMYGDTCRLLHSAVGGKIVYGDVLRWDDHV